MNPTTRSRVIGAFLVLALVAASLLLPQPSLSQEDEEIERVVMLQKARAATVLVVTIVEGFIVWEEFAPNLLSVGLQHPLYVRAPAVGSGFLVSPNGYIITNAHVINDWESDLMEKMPLLSAFVETFAQAYQEATGVPLDQPTLIQLFQEAVRAYTANRLNIQEYNVRVYVGMGKTLTGFGNIQDYLVARIIESRPTEREDLALIKVEVKRAPSLVVAQGDIAKVGDRVYAVGYPAIVHTIGAQIFEQESLVEPTITEGTVSGYRQKVTGVNVLQADVDVHGGNSGGPLINTQGLVVGVTSFGLKDPYGREVPGFNFFVPASIVQELLSRNNVDNTPDIVMEYFGEGLRLFMKKHYSASLEKFRLVKDLFPGFPYVDDYIAEAQAAIARGEDVPLRPRIFGIDVVVLGAVAALAGGSAAGVFLVLRRRRKPPAYPPQYVPPRPEQAAAQSAQQVAYDVGSEAHVQQAPLQPPSPPQGQQAGAQLQPEAKYCWNCGRKIPGDARLCPYCGVSQEEGVE